MAFESVMEAHKKQEVYHSKWKDLRSKKEITRTKIKQTIYHYEFTGDIVLHMRLKEIYYMLQNWLLLSHINKKAKFTINIGREKFSFRLFHANNSQLLIEPGNGKKLDSYDDLFEKNLRC